MAVSNTFPSTPQARAQLVAWTLNLDAPQDILAPDGGPSPDLLALCDKSGVTLDFILRGDMSLMVRDAYARAQRRAKQDTESRAYQVAALLRCAMLAEENEFSGLDWRGTASVLAVAEELMAGVIDGVGQIGAKQ
jgi:hypothetical protein